MRDTYTDRAELASHKWQYAPQSAAEPAQQCASCIHSFKGGFSDDLSREGILNRAVAGTLLCLLEMPLPGAGRCPAYREIAPDGGIFGVLEVMA